MLPCEAYRSDTIAFPSPINELLSLRSMIVLTLIWCLKFGCVSAKRPGFRIHKNIELPSIASSQRDNWPRIY